MLFMSLLQEKVDAVSSVDLSVSKLPSSLPLCELGRSVFLLPAFLRFPQRPLVDNI